jgi:type I restriction enzyme R subunit
MKKAFDLCAASPDISDTECDYIHFYVAVRSILFKLTKGDAPNIAQMNARVKEIIADAIEADGVEALFEAGTHIEEVDIFSE